MRLIERSKNDTKISNVSRRRLGSWPNYSMMFVLFLFCFRAACLKSIQMSVLVEQQDESINVIQSQAAGVEKDTEAG